MVHGYLRVSTVLQDLDNQKFGILEYTNKLNLGEVTFSKETISSRKKYESRDLSRLIDSLKDGDVLVVSELSRIGRSIMEIMSIFRVLIKKQVSTHVIKGGFVVDGDNKIQSSVLLFAFGLSAEIERDLISSRTKEALANKKLKGAVLGRKKGTIVKSKLDDKKDLIIDMLEKKVSVASLAKILGVARSTLVNFIQSRKLVKA